MKRLTITSLLTLLVFGGCSSESETQNRKILELEKRIEDIREILPPLYEEIVESCTTTKQEVTTFGVYTLTKKIIDQDYFCVTNIVGEALDYSGYFLPPSLSRPSLIESPTKHLLRVPWELQVKDIGEFFHISGYSGGAWCCEEDHFLSKKAPYEIVFEEHSKAGRSVLWGHFDSDIYKEIKIEDTNFIQWYGCTSCSALPVIYLEYSSDSFKLDKELMYSEASKKINNITKSGGIKFLPGDKYGSDWEGYDIPSELIEISSELIISGREEEARKFFDDMWPKDLPKKELFWQEFKEKLARSKYWELEVWESTEICDWFDPGC